MRVGVYIDGFNLYYGGRGLCGRSTPGWRWLDLRSLASDLAGRRTNWRSAQVSRVIYCTARIDGASNQSGQADQDVYLKALLAVGSVDHIEYGTYVARVKTAPLAVKDRQGRPVLAHPSWPIVVQDGHGSAVPGAVFMVSYANREEKGSEARLHVPVGVINPSRNYLAGDLRGDPQAGAGRHWWASLTAADLRNHQLPGQVGRYVRPDGW